jgi:hypothetical protein
VGEPLGMSRLWANFAPCMQTDGFLAPHLCPLLTVAQPVLHRSTMAMAPRICSEGGGGTIRERHASKRERRAPRLGAGPTKPQAGESVHAREARGVTGSSRAPRSSAHLWHAACACAARPGCMAKFHEANEG